MNIGILCPSDAELAPFLQRTPEAAITDAAMLRFYSGHIGALHLTAVYSGVCKVNAAIAAQLLIDRFAVEAILNVGTAGGMAERVQLFDLVIPEQMVYHDVAPDILTEYHPWLTENGFRPDPALLNAARQWSAAAGHPVHFGLTVTGEQFIEGSRREELNRCLAPLAADMETAAVAHVCYVNTIPFLAVRAITDTAQHDGQEHFEANCEAASEIAAAAALDILAGYHA